MRIWVLGAPDPEMSAIEALLESAGATVAYALSGDARVHPGNAYRATAVQYANTPSPTVVGEGVTEWVLVECDVPTPTGDTRTVVDHHRPGDPGFGRPAAEYLAASSVGQIVALLGCETDDAVRIVAAADHCLRDAYAGRCPGVDPEALGEWRAETRAAHQGRRVEDVLRDVIHARVALTQAPTIDVACRPCVGACDVVPGCGHLWVADMRGTPVPELPEAATRDGVGYVAGPIRDRDGREKLTVSGDPETVSAWMSTWAPEQGLVGIYGDPQRGFAGGYLPA